MGNSFFSNEYAQDPGTRSIPQMPYVMQAMQRIRIYHAVQPAYVVHHSQKKIYT